MIDTHAMHKSFTEAGFSEGQAEALIAPFRDLATKEDVARILDGMASRHDLATFRQEMGHEFAALRQDMGHDLTALRQETRHDLATLRRETRHGFAELRQEMKQDLAGLRQQVNHDLAGVRQEMKQDIAGLRQEMKEDSATLRSDVAVIAAKLDNLIDNINRPIATKKDVSDAKVTMLMWLIPFLAANILGIGSLVVRAL